MKQHPGSDARAALTRRVTGRPMKITGAERHDTGEAPLSSGDFDTRNLTALFSPVLGSCSDWVSSGVRGGYKRDSARRDDLYRRLRCAV